MLIIFIDRQHDHQSDINIIPPSQWFAQAQDGDAVMKHVRGFTVRERHGEPQCRRKDGFTLPYCSLGQCPCGDTLLQLQVIRQQLDRFFFATDRSIKQHERWRQNALSLPRGEGM
ncbi:hypothetical protein D3C85_1085840 [compost metagenome]